VHNTELIARFEGTLLEDLTGGHYELAVTWETLPIYDEKGEITEKLLNRSLPIKNGSYLSIEKNGTVKSEIPDGSYVITTQAWDTNNTLLTCLEVKFKLGKEQSQFQPQLPQPPTSPLVSLPTDQPATLIEIKKVEHS